MSEGALTYSCAKCGQPPDDLLIMTCAHNLCLTCAGKNLAREQGKGVHIDQLVVCDICGEETVLEPNSAIELLKMLPVRLEDAGPRHHLEDELVEIERRKPAPNYSRESLSRDMCRDHPDEEVYYFCLDCECECVCSECVVHGEHREHNVQTIKKAAAGIRGKVDEMVTLLSSKLDALSQSEQRLEAKRKDLEDQSATLKQQISHAFGDLRQRLEKKERETLENVDLATEERVREMENFSRLVGQKTTATMTLIDSVKRELSINSPEHLLNFYATTKDRIYANAEGDRSELQQVDQAAEAKSVLEVSPILDKMKAMQLQLADLNAMGESLRPESSYPAEFAQGSNRGRHTIGNLGRTVASRKR